MKNPQDNFPSLSAFLRAADSVDTLETNSLCCAAAGIIAPSSATAEALIPHEKLREAASLDATLIAQNGMLAQPVEGYRQSIAICLVKLLRSDVWMPTYAARGISVHLSNSIQRMFNGINRLLQRAKIVSIFIVNAFMGFHSRCNFNGFSKECLNGINVKIGHGWERPIQDETIGPLFLKDIGQADFVWLQLCRAQNTFKRTEGFIRGIFSEMKRLRFVHSRLVFSCFSFQFMCSISHKKCSDNRCYRTESLYPSGDICRQPPVPYPVGNRSNQNPNPGTSKKQKPNSPQRALKHLLWDFKPAHYQWILSFKKIQACLLPSYSSIKGVA